MTPGNRSFPLGNTRRIRLVYASAAAVTLTEPLPQRAPHSYSSGFGASVRTKHFFSPHPSPAGAQGFEILSAHESLSDRPFLEDTNGEWK